MPLHPSPLRSVETRERHRTRMTCCLPPRGAIANGCRSRKSYPLVAMAQSAQGWRDDDGCGWADGTLQPPRCPLWVKSGHWKTSRQCPLYPRKRTSEPARVLPSTQQLRQLGDIRRDPPRLIFGGELGRRAPARFVLVKDVSELLFVCVAHDVVVRLQPSKPRGREAAYEARRPIWNTYCFICGLALLAGVNFEPLWARF